MSFDINIGNVLFSICIALIGLVYNQMRTEVATHRQEQKLLSEALRELEMKVADKHPTKEELASARISSEARHTKLEIMITDLGEKVGKLITRMEVLVAREDMEQQRPTPKRRR